MLSNAYFLAKFRFGTAENEPTNNLQNFAAAQQFSSASPEVLDRVGEVQGLTSELAARRTFEIFRNVVSMLSVSLCSKHSWFFYQFEDKRDGELLFVQ